MWLGARLFDGRQDPSTRIADDRTVGLRDAIGDPLFVRDGRGLVPTARAKELAMPVRRALGELGSALAGRTFEPRRAVARPFLHRCLGGDRTDHVMSATSVLANAVAQVLPVRSVRHPHGAPEVTISQYWHPRHHDDPAHRWLRGLVAAVDFAA